MATAGPNITGTAISGAADGNTGGNNPWASPANAQSDNGVFTTSSTDMIDQHTAYLNCQNFGFSIPAGATINGITAEVKIKTDQSPHTWAKSGVGGHGSGSIKTIKGGVIGGTDQIANSTLTTTSAYFSFGGAANLWGQTWTPADINASNFGVAVSVGANNTPKSNSTVSIDAVRITITYTPAAGGAPVVDTRRIFFM